MNCSMSLASGEFLAPPPRHETHEDQLEPQVACSGKNLKRTVLMYECVCTAMS